MMSDISDRTRDLTEYANAGGQTIQPHQPPSGHALVRPTTGIAERVIGAQPVAVQRDEQRILQKLATLGAAAGTDWFYRFPVKNKDGSRDWIEGPSIKLANDIARIFGNDVIEVREIDVGDAWVFYSRFTDIETGFSMERAYRQRKSQTSLKTKDADRQQDIAYQIGQSKAIRNVICNSLQIYSDYAFEHARNSLVEKIGKEMPRYRERILEGLKNMPVDVHRAERAIGRAFKDWLAPDMAQIIAMMKSVADGMATADEVFPLAEEITPPSPDVAGAPAAQVGAPAAQATDGDGGGGVQQPAAARAPAAADPTTERVDVRAVAYERGKKANAAGIQRRALPGEYRTPEREAEAKAWQQGHDDAEAAKAGAPGAGATGAPGATGSLV